MAFFGVALLSLPLGGASLDAREEAERPHTYQVVDGSLRRHPETRRVVGWGRIEGHVRLSHDVDASLLDARELAEALDHDLKTRALAGAFVHIEAIGRGRDWPPGMATGQRFHELEVLDDRYEPAVSWTRVRARVVFDASDLRTDRRLTGFFRDATEPLWDLPLTAGRPRLLSGKTLLKQAGLYVLESGPAPLARAYVWCSLHPYVTPPTTRNGRYVLEDVPPGSYVLKCWHAGIDWGSEDTAPARRLAPVVVITRILVAPNRTTSLDWTIPVPEHARARP